MMYEPTTLAATGSALVEVLGTYGCDPREVFARAGLTIDDLYRPGARYPLSATIRLWQEVALATGDPCVGLYVARRFKPQSLHALGLSWMASRTLDDGFKRMVRYARIANSSLEIERIDNGDQIGIASQIAGGSIERPPENADANLGVILVLCRYITSGHFAPEQVTLRHGANGHTERYVEFFQAPVFFSQAQDAIYFDAQAVREPLPSGNEELAKEVDRIADRYLATLAPNLVRDKVREILLTLMPSGHADQRAVARAMNRSVSALQRQLRAEGASFRQVLDETREQMAMRLVREREYSLGQIAYLLGFSEQANFSRAFKRWTGTAPTEYRK